MTEQLAGLAKALASAQAEFTTVKRRHVNPFYKSHYAALEDVVEMIRPILPKHGLSYSQLPQTIDGEPALETRVMHQSGESLVSVIRLNPEQKGPQKVAAAMTYYRRMTLSAVLGVVTEEEDDDGNATTTQERFAPQGKGIHSPPEFEPVPEFPFEDASLGEAVKKGAEMMRSKEVVPPMSRDARAAASMPTEKQIKRLFAICHAHNWNQTKLKGVVEAAYGKRSVNELTLAEYDELCFNIENGKENV